MRKVPSISGYAPLVYLLFCACEYTRVYTWDQIEFNDNQTGVCLVCRNQSPVLSSFMIYHWVCNKSNTTGVTIPSGAPEFTPPYFSICSVLCYVLQIVVCPYFLFAIVSSVLLWFIASDYPFGIVTIFQCQSFRLIFEYNGYANSSR
jgi:hypothetical protein